MRRRIYEIIEVSKEGDGTSLVYDIAMIGAIVLSILQLAFKEDYAVFDFLDVLTTVIFIIDYILRLVTADYKLEGRGISAFIRYPFTPMAIIDLLSILPTITVLYPALKSIRFFGLFRAFRVFRLFKVVRYSRSMTIIAHVIEHSKDALGAVVMLAAGYILVSALVVFNVEEETFTTFFDAVYWATVSLTTVGYGDIYPVTMPGRVITMISSVFGIAIVALPAGIITAGYMEELHEIRKQKERAKEAVIMVDFDPMSMRSVAYDEDKQVGWCRYEARHGAWVIVETVVEPEYKERGIGGRLVLTVGKHAKQVEMPLLAEDPFAKNVLSL